MMMMPHPRAATLGRHADGAAPGPRLAAHLLRCPRCRAAVSEMRALADAARAAAPPPPAADALDRILARRAAGERVLLPAGPAPARPRIARRGIMAAAAVLVLAAGALLLRPHELEAGRSELRLLPANPQPGQTVRVEYRPGVRLEHEPVVVLRADERPLAGSGFADHARVVARLTRTRGGVFTGSYTLPDAVVYARFAVEDTAGSRVDVDGGWDTVVHGRDGRPRLDGLLEQYHALQSIDRVAAHRAARRMVSLYPDQPAAWLRLYWASDALATAAQHDSVTRAHTPQLRRLAARVNAAPWVPSGQLAELIQYAKELGDSAQATAWRARLLSVDTTSAVARDELLGQVVERYRGQNARELAEIERLWNGQGPVLAHMAYNAMMIAHRAGDADAVLRWGDRFAAAEPAAAPAATSFALRYPQIRPQAMDRARRTIRALLAEPGEQRPLEVSVPEYVAQRRREAAYFLGELGKALAAQGRHAAARDTLELAMAGAWDVEVFRSVAQVRLALGDTAGAVQAFAHAAADPATPPALADSVRARFGSRVTPAQWRAQVARARGQLAALLRERSVNRPVRGRVRMADARGRPRELDPASAGPTLVAWWSRFCPSSLSQLGQRLALAAELQRRGVRVVTVTDEAPSAEVSAFLAGHGYTFPVWYDVDRTARRAFDNAATPRYQVLDHDGRIRFESYGIDDVLREVAVLQDAQRAGSHGL